jgi:small subunit ribosomal protein S20
MFRRSTRRSPELANHKSAKKRARQSRERRDRNHQVLSRVRTVVKGVRKTLEGGDAEAAGTRLRAAERELRRAAGKGIIPRRRASRSVARLARAVHKAR